MSAIEVSATDLTIMVRIRIILTYKDETGVMPPPEGESSPFGSRPASGIVAGTAASSRGEEGREE